MGFKITAFQLNLPFGLGGASVIRTEAQVKAAWALYVEYATRISTQKLEPGEGSIREALTSLYKLFDITRTVLKQEGPGVAEGINSVGPMAIQTLNEGIRPFLVKWHTKLGAFETAQALEQQGKLAPGAAPIIDEGQWEEAAKFYAELDKFRLEFLQYVNALGELAGLEEEKSGN